MQDGDVQSQELMGWVNDETTGLRSPSFAGDFVWREPSKCLEAISEVAGSNEVREVSTQLAILVEVEAFDSRLLSDLVTRLATCCLGHFLIRRRTMPFCRQTRSEMYGRIQNLLLGASFHSYENNASLKSGIEEGLIDQS